VLFGPGGQLGSASQDRHTTAAFDALPLQNEFLHPFAPSIPMQHRLSAGSVDKAQPGRKPAMIVVAMAWLYVVLMMALAEAFSSQGTVLGAIFTFILYGLLPLSILLYVMGAPGRARARRAAERGAASADAPDGSDHAPGDAVPTERKEP